jgi:hypothetical protein
MTQVFTVHGEVMSNDGEKAVVEASDGATVHFYREEDDLVRFMKEFAVGRRLTLSKFDPEGLVD